MWMRGALSLALASCVISIAICFIIDRRNRVKPLTGSESTAPESSGPPAPPPDLHTAVRPAPASFPPDSNLPRGKEFLTSGPIDLKTFNPEKDLIRFEDTRVWFNSDTKTSLHAEDDHLIHRALEVPLKRLVNLLEKRQKHAQLKIHDAYRHPETNTPHLSTSLHWEGRSLDLHSEGTGLTELAKLAWQAGFDFVLYEKPRKSGAHLHCSVRRSPDALDGSRPGKTKRINERL